MLIKSVHNYLVVLRGRNSARFLVGVLELTYEIFNWPRNRTKTPAGYGFIAQMLIKIVYN